MSRKLEHIKSPLSNMMHMFPESDSKALRQTFYNSVALIFIAFVAAAAISVYFILEPFLKPLIWATLVGTCIHPFKSTLTEGVRQWLKSMDSTGQPLIVGAITLPLKFLDSIAELTTQKLLKYAKILLFGFISLPLTYILYYYGPLRKLISLAHASLILLSKTLGLFSTYWVASFIIAYILLVLFAWTPQTSTWLKRLSIPIWAIVIVHLAAITGSLSVPVFFFFVFMMLTGAITYAKDHNQSLFSMSYIWVIWMYVTNPRSVYGSNSNALGSTDEEEGEGMNGVDDNTVEEECENKEEEGQEDLQSTPVSSPPKEGPIQEVFESSRESEGSSSDMVRQRKGDSTDLDPAGGSQGDEMKESKDVDGESGDDVETPKSWIQWIDKIMSREASSPTSSPIGQWGPGTTDVRAFRRRTSSGGSSTAGSASSTQSIVRRAFIFLFWAHLLVYSWRHLWLIQLLPIVFIMVGIKKIAGRLGDFGACRWCTDCIGGRVSAALGERKEALAPLPVRGLIRLMLRGDKKIRQFLDASLDNVISIGVIMLVLVGTLFVTIFIAFQVHSESIHLVTMTSSVLNNTMHSELYSWLPERDYMKTLADSMVGNAYIFGRDWISKKIDQLFDTNPYNKARIEEQALELWDKLYQRIISKNDSNISVGDVGGPALLLRQHSLSSLPSSMASLWDTLTTFDLLDVNQVITFVKENVGILQTVLESVWVLLKSNVNLCLSLVTAVLSIVFGGGTVVLNFIVSSLIFLTTLFYLLAFSGESYLPVQFVTSLTPAADTSPTIKSFYRAVEAAISGVFAATAKMALFYGFYTALTHTLFGVNLVVIPSVLAALFGAIPFLGTYWAAVPGVLELLLVHQEVALAVVLFLCHLLPTYMLDTAIYAEIKGAGHPYMTGLAIAGGVYCLGLEGALVGPILLCCLLVAVNLYSNMLAPPPCAEGGVCDQELPSKSRRGARKVQFTRKQ